MKPARVLFIEPDRDLGETVAEGLNDWGVEVQLHTDPRAGFERLVDQGGSSPDVVVLDMPPPLEELQWFLDGLKAHQRAASVPVIATVSVLGVPGGLARQCAHFVWKPYTIDSLLNAMELVLRRRIRLSEPPP